MTEFQEYPKWKYHPVKEAVVVGHKDAEDELGSGWFDTPASFCEPDCEESHGVGDIQDKVVEIAPVKKTRKAKA